MMMKNIPFVWVILLLLLFTSCAKNYKVEGTSAVSVIDGKMIYLKIAGENGMITVDSAEVVHGSFSMSGKLDSIMMVSIFMDGENYTPMVLEEGTVKVEITPSGINVKGTPLNDKLFSYICEKDALDQEMEEATRLQSQLIMDGVEAEDATTQAMQKAREVNVKMQALTKRFIQDNYENVLGTSVFLMVCASSFPYPMLNEELQELIDKAPASFKNNLTIKEYVASARDNMLILQREMAQRQQASPQFETDPNEFSASTSKTK
ncbi:MAG: DUF4369 domain-containing protein [Bacteroidaceae bacterium]